MSDWRWEEVRESAGDGDFGDIMGWHVKGHDLIDLDDIELFIAEQNEEGDYGAPFDVKQRWVRKVPNGFGYLYVYSSTPGRGAYPVTSILQAWVPRNWCKFHEFEPAVVGLPHHMWSPVQTSEYLHVCRDCGERVERGRRRVVKLTLAKYYAVDDVTKADIETSIRDAQWLWRLAVTP